MLIAHRGGLYYRPENSCAALDYSLQNGLNWVEVDIRLSQDNIPILSHDEVVDTSDGEKRAVRSLTFQTLRKLDIGGGEVVPGLADVLYRYKEKLAFNLEIKELDAVDAVLAQIDHQDMANRVLITSFIPEAVQMVHQATPDLARGLLLDRLTGRIVRGRSGVRAAGLLGCKYILPHYNIVNRAWIDAAHQEGLKVLVWTVNLPTDAERLLEWGVDGIISDRPDFLIPMVNRFHTNFI